VVDSPGDAADAAQVGADPYVGVACPLLVVVGSGAADPAERAGNRCAASDPPTPLSLIQQRLVCLEAGHVDCPRYLRATGSARGGSGRLGRQASARSGSTVGVVAAAKPGRGRRRSTTAGSGDVPPSSEAMALGMVGGDLDSQTSTAGPAPSAGSSASSAGGLAASAAGGLAGSSAPIVPVAPVVRSTRRSGARPARSRPGPIVVALGILVAALVIAFAFTSYRGGLTLPGAVPDPGSNGPSSIPSDAVSPSPPPAPSPTAIPSPSPSPSPSAAPSPTGTPGPSVPPAFVGLKPCPDAPDCYLYRVRSGDTLTGIAEHFGVTKAAVQELNPEITNPSLIHVGDMIRIPLPPG
jgi:LysM domain-containing protein